MRTSSFPFAADTVYVESVTAMIQVDVPCLRRVMDNKQVRQQRGR